MCCRYKNTFAYSSVIHMGMMVVGVMLGYIGVVLMIVVHGFSSPAMFSLANLGYEMMGRRNLCLQRGVDALCPLGSLLWFVILCCNVGAFPPSPLTPPLENG